MLWLNSSRLPKQAARTIFVMVVSLLTTMVLFTACAPPFSGQSSSASHVQFQRAPGARITYVAIGASDTYGVGAADPDEQNWAVDLSHQLGSGVRLVNLGIPGIDAHDALSAELPVALDAHPNLVTIWLAVNDLLDNVPVEQYQSDMNTLLTRLQTAFPHAVIAVANVPDLTLLPAEAGRNKAQLQAAISGYNAALANVISRHHAVLIDLYQKYQTLATHPEYISSDGLHPNALGYAQVAAAFYQKLQMYKL